MRKTLFATALLFSLALAAPASATIVLSDNFDGENAGASQLNYTGFANWASTGGAFVDLVATPDFGITCAGGSGSCVDLDGSPGPGEIQTLASFAFNAGDLVSFSYDFSGSQRGTTEDFSFGFRSQGGSIDYNNVQLMTDLFGNQSFGNFSQTNLSLFGTLFPSNTPFGNVTFSFTAGNAGSFKTFLASASSDNVGILIDNVSIDITAVPEPASWAMMIAGFGLVGSAMRRRKPLAKHSFA